jgi:ADP-ribose pyrophosphatase YjhB (NUDIX family)
MRTNQRAGIAIIKDSKILLIKRTKNEEHYYILPGGGVESNETPEEAAVRELKEELEIQVTIIKKIAEFEHRGNIEHYYLSDNFLGNINVIGDGVFNSNISDEALWLDINKIEEINLLPDKIKSILIDLKNDK